MTCTNASTLKPQATIPLLPAVPPTTPSAWQAVRIVLQNALSQIIGAAGVTGVNVIPQQYAFVSGSTLPPIASTSNCTVALDASTTLFGAGTYKITITGTPATVTFVADTAWPIHPNWQWLVSFFQQASAVVSGELTITTSGGTAYNTSFKTTPSTSGFQRLYDTLNLGADGSTAFGLSFTFTSATGQTVWLDGLMQEPYFGVAMQPSPFISTSAALTLDNQPDGSTYLRMPGANMDPNRRGLIDFTQSGHLNKNLDNIGDGTTYARILGSQLTSGAHKLTVAGSGMQVGDQRNLPQGAVNNFSATYSGFTPSYSTTTSSSGSGVCTFTFPAFTLELTAGGSASYGATSAAIAYVGTVPSGGVNTGPYYFWYTDPTYAGGNLTLNYSTNIAAAQGPGNIFLGAFQAYYAGPGGTASNPYGIGAGGSPGSRTLGARIQAAGRFPVA